MPRPTSLLILLILLAASLASGCSSLTASINSGISKAINDDPVLATSIAVELCHAECNCNVWIITPCDADPDHVQIFLAYSSDGTVRWHDSGIRPTTVSQSLCACNVPSTRASPTFVLEAIDRTGQCADVLLLSGFESDAMASDRVRILTGLPGDWTADPKEHWAMRKALEYAEPQQSK